RERGIAQRLQRLVEPEGAPCGLGPGLDTRALGAPALGDLREIARTRAGNERGARGELGRPGVRDLPGPAAGLPRLERSADRGEQAIRSEEHTSELQSRGHLVCRLLLEKKN